MKKIATCLIIALFALPTFSFFTHELSAAENVGTQDGTCPICLEKPDFLLENLCGHGTCIVCMPHIAVYDHYNHLREVVYDILCPMCRARITDLQNVIRDQYGTLHVTNARELTDTERVALERILTRYGINKNDTFYVHNTSQVTYRPTPLKTVPRPKQPRTVERSTTHTIPNTRRPEYRDPLFEDHLRGFEAEFPRHDDRTGDDQPRYAATPLRGGFEVEFPRHDDRTGDDQPRYSATRLRGGFEAEFPRHDDRTGDDQPRYAATRKTTPSKFKFVVEALVATGLSYLARSLYDKGLLTHDNSNKRAVTYAALGFLGFGSQSGLAQFNPDRQKNALALLTSWGIGMGLGGFLLPKIVSVATKKPTK